MKKLFPILALSMIIGLFSSCIINFESSKYTMYFDNDTSTQYIYDWYVKDSNNHNYTISSEYCPVPPGEYSSISGLSEGNYQVWFCIYSNPRRDTDVYMHPESFVHVDADVTFSLYDESYTYGRARSAANGEETEESRFVLIDSKGNRYPLVETKK